MPQAVFGVDWLLRVSTLSPSAEGETHWPAFIVLLGLAGELSVKAYIMQNVAGADDKLLKSEIGHDLLKGLSKAVEAGYAPPSTDTEKLFALLDAPYRDHSARYLTGTTVAMKDFDVMLRFMARHIIEIGFQLGTDVALPASGGK